MTHAKAAAGAIVGCLMLVQAAGVAAQDWPQWRGPHRNGKATGFQAPKSWPKQLTQQWKVQVGEGVASPALVGDRLYLFTRRGGKEVILCLDAASGKEQWQDGYEVQPPTRPGSGFNNEFVGPRSSPAVADGKVVTLGARGTLSCLDAASGKVLWRKNDFKGSWPRFFTSCSPLIVSDLCIVQLGGESKGGIVAYELASGNEKWRWAGDGTAYASPVLDTAAGAKQIVAETAANIVGINVADGKLLWQVPFAVPRGGYNACTPIVDGPTIVFSGWGRGTKAVKIEKQDDKLTANEQWSNPEISVQFNSPVVKDDWIFGISQSNVLFCLNAKDGKTAWTKPLTAPGGGGKRRGPSGYGSIVDAGPVLLALTPSARLIVFEPNGKEFKQLATYKVADTQTYAHPVLSGKRIFVKDRDSLLLWTTE